MALETIDMKNWIQLIWQKHVY